MFKQIKHFKIVFSLILSFIFVSCENTVDSPYPAIEFKQQATISSIGRSSAVSFAINGKGYVALGRTGSRVGYLNDCWEYDPTQDSWTVKTNFPGIGRVKAIAAVVDSNAYVGLGFANDQVYQNTGYLTDLWMFNPARNEWSQKKDIPGKATDACVSFVYKDNIYIGSGFDGYGFNADFWRYSPKDDSWTKLNKFPGSTRACPILCTNGDRIFFGTGYDTYNCNDWWEYFPESDTWTQLKAMPDGGRENGVALSVNNRFFVATGRFFAGSQTGGHVKSDIFEYDAKRNVWYKRGNIPNGERENAIAFTINGKGYIGFGENDNSVLNDFWSFEP